MTLLKHPAAPATLAAIVALALSAAPVHAAPPEEAMPPEGVTSPDAVLLPPPPARAVASAADSIVAGMVAAVEPDSIHAFLAKLSGETPVLFGWGPETILSRYTGSAGAEHAAEFLGNVFDGYGYTVEMHYFTFTSTLEKILIHAGGPGLCVGTNGRILRTEDGTTWQRAKQGIETFTAVVRGIDHAAGDSYVAVGHLGFIATSDDAGSSWTVRSSTATARLNAVDVTASGGGWIAGKNGVVLTTTDGGSTWSDQSSGVTSFLYDVVAFDDLTVAIVGAGGVILRTTDAGATWSSVSSGTPQDLFSITRVGDSAWTVGKSGVVLSSTDRGLTWSAQPSGTTSNLNDVSFSDGQRGWVVGAASTVLRTVDGGASWISQDSGLSGNVTLRGVHAVSTDTGWIVGVGGILLRTMDEGGSWALRKASIEDGWANVVASLPGTTAPEEEVLLVGHYDTTSNAPDPSTLAPGADDNGTGIATIVEAARHLADARYERTVKFVCFSGEEIGLLGSAAYAARAEALGTQITGVFNVDCVGWNDDYFRIFSDDTSEWLGNIAHTMATTHAPGLPTYHSYCPSCGWSDHSSFWQRGFDAIVGIETWEPPPPQHHTPGDTLGLLNMTLVADVTKIALATIATVAGVDTAAVVSVDELASGTPTQNVLLGSYPNPFRDETKIRYDLASRGRVKITIHDIGGRLVQTLEESSRSPGRYTVPWDGRDGGGNTVSSGLYFYRLETEGIRQTRKLVHIR